MRYRGDQVLGKQCLENTEGTPSNKRWEWTVNGLSGMLRVWT